MRVDIKAHPEHRNYRCYLNGEDISEDCFRADDEEGWADVYAKNKNGKHFQIAGVRVTERLHGEIRLEMPTNRTTRWVI